MLPLHHRRRLDGSRWGGWRNSNPQRPGPRPGALPVELQPQRWVRDSNSHAREGDSLATRSVTVPATHQTSVFSFLVHMLLTSRLDTQGIDIGPCIETLCHVV